MTIGNISQNTQDNESSVVSGITSVDSINTDNGLSLQEKKRKIDGIYLSAQWNDENEYEISKLGKLFGIMYLNILNLLKVRVMYLLIKRTINQEN